MFYPTTCVRFRYGALTDWGLAGFLGSMVTTAVGLPRRALRTVPFQHPPFAYPGGYTYAV